MSSSCLVKDGEHNMEDFILINSKKDLRVPPE